jgi:subtilisin family serine protease
MRVTATLLLALALVAGLAAAFNMTHFPPTRLRRAAGAGADLVVTVARAWSWSDIAQFIVRLDSAGVCTVASVAQATERTLLAVVCAAGTDQLAASSSILTAVDPADELLTAIAPNLAVTLADTAETQPSAPWHLDRLDQRLLPLDGLFHYASLATAGTGVPIYILDTGIRPTHSEFGSPSRAQGVLNTIDATDPEVDCHGHGTHVASSAAGLVTGVAKNAPVHAIKVLNCAGGGTTFSVAAGLAYVEDECAADQVVVVSMSLAGGASSTLDNAVNSVLATCHSVVVVAAANAGGDACDWSPARVPGAVTVGATNADDTWASFSNRGSCVDLVAPGVNVVGASPASDSSWATMSGTSMATPLVAGMAAVYASQARAHWTGNVGNAGTKIRDFLLAHTTAPPALLAGAADKPLGYSASNASEALTPTPPPLPPAHPPVAPHAPPPPPVYHHSGAAGMAEPSLRDFAKAVALVAWTVLLV